MPHSPSPLQLLSHRFLSFECIATDGSSTDGELSLVTKPTLRQGSENPREWQVLLRVEFTPENPDSPSMYQGHVAVEGKFCINESFKEENCEALVRVTAVSILYGACRELIAGFTARSTHGELSLPSISFRENREEKVQA